MTGAGDDEGIGRGDDDEGTGADDGGVTVPTGEAVGIATGAVVPGSRSRQPPIRAVPASAKANPASTDRHRPAMGSTVHVERPAGEPTGLCVRSDGRAAPAVATC